MSQEIDEFTKGYIECALWLADDEPQPGQAWQPHGRFTVDGIDENSLRAMIDDCRSFQEATARVLAETYEIHHNYTPYQAGIDLWLTRNRHGSGYWDQGPGDYWLILTDWAHTYGGAELYHGDDGALHYCDA